MPKGIKASSLERMAANAVKFGEAAKKALAKTAEMRKEAADKIAAYEKTVKATLKDAKAASKNANVSGGTASAAPAKRVATKKTAAKKVGAKKVTAKKVSAKKVAKKTASL